MIKLGKTEPAEEAHPPDGLTTNEPPAIMARSGTALSVLAIIAFLFVLRFAQDVIIPVVLSILIGYALDPIVTGLTKLRIHRALAAAIVLLGLAGAIGATAYGLRFQAIAVLDALPEGARKLRDIVQANQPGANALGKVQEAASEVEKTATTAAGTPGPPRGVTRVQVEEPAFRASDFLWSGSMGVLALIAQATLIFFLVYFLLASGDLYKRKLVKIAGPTLSQKKLTVQILDEINTQIERFLLVQALTSVLVAIVTGLALWMLGLNQPAVWGLAAGILNSIPYFGPVIVSSGLTLVAFLQFGTLTQAAYVAGAALVITTLEGYLLTPALMGRTAHINQVALFISLLFWSWMWGVVGLILAVPIMMAIKTACDRIEGLQEIGELLGEKESPVTSG